MNSFLKKMSYLILAIIILLGSLPFFFIKNISAQQNSVEDSLNPSLQLLGAGARWAARQGNSVLYVNWKDNWLSHYFTDGKDWYYDAWTKYMDDFRISITKALKNEDFSIKYTGDIPDKLSDYDLVLINAWFAVEPHHAPIIRDYVKDGGAVVLLSGIPCYFSVYCKDNWPYRLGGTDLISIQDWFGAGEYWNTGGFASLVVNNPFNTSLSNDDVIFSINGRSSAFIHSLSADSKVIAKWNSENVNGFPYYYDEQVFAFTHEYGEGRVYYQAHFELDTNENIEADSTSDRIADSDTSRVPNSVSPLPTPLLTVSCQSSTSFLDFRAKISGILSWNGTGLADLPILLSYSVDGGNSWIPLTLVNTDENGEFMAVWLLSVTGNYLLRAKWEGNSSYAKTSTEISFSVTLSDDQSVISVASNSTISAFVFNFTAGKLTFNVAGPSGTTGYTYVYIPKSLIPDISNLQIFIDENPIDFNEESTGDSWLVTLTYNHSSHRVAMKLNDTLSTPKIPTKENQLDQWVTYIMITTIGSIFVIFIVKKQPRERTEANTTKKEVDAFSQFLIIFWINN